MIGCCTGRRATAVCWSRRRAARHETSFWIARCSSIPWATLARGSSASKVRETGPVIFKQFGRSPQCPQTPSVGVSLAPRQLQKETAHLVEEAWPARGRESLLRAGLLPAITKAGAVPGIALCQRCVIRPSEGPNAIASLAAGLLRDEAFPELAKERTAGELADQRSPTTPGTTAATPRSWSNTSATTTSTWTAAICATRRVRWRTRSTSCRRPSSG